MKICKCTSQQLNCVNKRFWSMQLWFDWIYSRFMIEVVWANDFNYPTCISCVTDLNSFPTVVIFSSSILVLTFSVSLLHTLFLLSCCISWLAMLYIIRFCFIILYNSSSATFRLLPLLKEWSWIENHPKRTYFPIISDMIPQTHHLRIQLVDNADIIAISELLFDVEFD